MSRFLTLGGLVVAGIILATQLPADDPAIPNSNSRSAAPDYGPPTLAPPAIPMPPIPDNGPSSGSRETYDSHSYSNPPMSSGTYNHVDSAPAYPSEPTFHGDHVDSDMPMYSDPSYDDPSILHGPVYSDAPQMMHDDYGPSQPVYSAPAAGCGCNGGAGMMSTYDGYSSYGDGDRSMGYVNAPTPYEVGGGSPYTGAFGGGSHVRHPFYSYRAPWYYRGPASQNVTIVW